MAKTSGKTSSNPRGRRPAAGGAKRNAPSPLTTLLGGLKDLMKVNFDNRRIPTLIGLVLAACFVFACLALITFLFSGGSDQSLILASGEGEATAELAREAKNIFGLPGARIADYLFNQLFGWGIVFALSYLAFLFAHLIWRPRIAPYRYVTNFLINGFLLLWTSVAAAGLQSLFPSDSFLRWGGLRGEELFTYIYKGSRHRRPHRCAGLHPTHLRCDVQQPCPQRSAEPQGAEGTSRLCPPTTDGLLLSPLLSQEEGRSAPERGGRLQPSRRCLA